MSKTSGTSGTAWHCLAATLFSSGTRCGFVSRSGCAKPLHRLPYRVYRKIYEYLFLHLAREERVIASFAFVLRTATAARKGIGLSPYPYYFERRKV